MSYADPLMKHFFGFQNKFEIFKGTVKNVSFSGEYITLKSCTIQGKSFPGCQQINFDQIVKLDILKEGDGSIASPDRSSNEQVNGGLSRPMGRNRNYRNDNQHLDKLHPVQVSN